jgi:hypothetical protein
MVTKKGSKEKRPVSASFITVCVTLDREFVKQVTDFCYENGIARSATVEYALMRLLDGKEAPELALIAKRIKASGGDRTSRRNRYVGKA